MKIKKDAAYKFSVQCLTYVCTQKNLDCVILPSKLKVVYPGGGATMEGHRWDAAPIPKGCSDLFFLPSVLRYFLFLCSFEHFSISEIKIEFIITNNYENSRSFILTAFAYVSKQAEGTAAAWRQIPVIKMKHLWEKNAIILTQWLQRVRLCRKKRKIFQWLE